MKKLRFQKKVIVHKFRKFYCVDVYLSQYHSAFEKRILSVKTKSCMRIDGKNNEKFYEIYKQINNEKISTNFIVFLMFLMYFLKSTVIDYSFFPKWSNFQSL